MSEPPAPVRPPPRKHIGEIPLAFQPFGLVDVPRQLTMVVSEAEVLKVLNDFNNFGGLRPRESLRSGFVFRFDTFWVRAGVLGQITSRVGQTLFVLKE